MGVVRPTACALILGLVSCGSPEETAPPERLPNAATETRGRAPVAGTASHDVARWDRTFVGGDEDQRAARAQVIARLYAQLRSATEDDERAWDAMELLPEFGAAAIDGALALLDCPNAHARDCALRILADLGPTWRRTERSEEVVRAALARLRDPSQDVVDSAFTLLYDSSKELGAIVADLGKLLAGAELPRDVHLVDELISLCYELDRTASPCIDALIPYVAYDDTLDSSGALSSMRPLRPEQVDALVALAKGGSRERRLEVIRVLERWGDDAAARAGDFLLELVSSDDNDVREAAIGALAEMPTLAERSVLASLPLAAESDAAGRVVYEMSAAVRRMLPALVAEADAAPTDRRVLLLRALHHINWGDEPAPDEQLPLAAVRRWLADPDAEVRQAAVELIEYGDFEYREGVDAYAELETSLRDADAGVRRAAVRAYAHMARYDRSRGNERLRALLADASPDVRVAAAAAVRDVDALAAALSFTDAGVRRSASWALREIGESAKRAAPAVAAWLDRSRGDEQVDAVRTLEEIEADDEDSVRALARVLDDPEHAAFSIAISALKDLGPRAAPAAEALARAGADGTWGSEALDALVAIGPEAATEPVLAVLVEFLGELGDRQADDVLEAVAAFGAAARPCEPAVRALLPRRQLRSECLAALAAIVADRKAFAAELIARMRRDPSDRDEIHAALLGLGPAGADALILTSDHGANDTNRAARLEAVARALATYGGAGRDAVVRALGDAASRTSGVRLLIVLERSEWKPRLRAAFDDADLDVRRAAAHTLEDLWDRDFDATQFARDLIALLPDDSEGAAAAARVLGRMRSVPADAEPALEAALAHERPSVRTDAAGALFRITGRVEPALDTLIGVLRLRSSHADCWGRVGEYLAEMGTRASPAAQALNDAVLRSSDATHLVHAIGTLGPGAGPAIPALRAVLGGDAGHVFGGTLLNIGLAVETARLLGPTARAALPELRELHESPPRYGCFIIEDDDEEFRKLVRRAIRAVTAE